MAADKESVKDVLKRLEKEGVRVVDPSRQISDAEAVISAFPYLRPTVGTLPGAPQRFLKLEGTVQMFYQSNGYFVPLSVYLRENHPASPPVCIITPTPEMMIKPAHRHVDNQGVVYLPYLHEWSRNSKVVDMIRAVGDVFTADPFIYKRPKAAPTPPATPPYVAPGAQAQPPQGTKTTPVYAQTRPAPGPATAVPPRHPPPPPPQREAGKVVTKDTLLTKSKQVEELDSVLEASFRCPISMEIMQDPVFAADGHTYERTEIERWLLTKNTSPLTNEVLPHKVLTPNHNLRSQIRDYYSEPPTRS